MKFVFGFMVEETGNESGEQKGSTRNLSCDPRPSLGTGRINEEQMVAALRSVLSLQNAHLSESLSTLAALCCITRTRQHVGVGSALNLKKNQEW